MKLWAIPCRTTQDGQVMVESSDKMRSTGEGNGKLLQYSCLENLMNNMKRQKDRILKVELPRLVGAQYTTGKGQRNSSRKNEETEPKQKQWPVVDVTGDENKVRCCKEQYSMEIWNVRSMNQATWKWPNRRWQLSSGHRTGKGQFSFQSLRKSMPKNIQSITQLYASHKLAK